MSVFAVPGWVRVVSGGSRGSFAACGRDAGLKTGVPLPAARSAGRSLDGAPPQSNLTDPTYPTPWLHRENWRRSFATGLLWSGAMPTAEKSQWQRTLFAAVDFGGKCERGLPPFTINNDKSELAAARLRRARKFRFPARSAGRPLGGAPPQSNLMDPTYPALWPRPETARPDTPRAYGAQGSFDSRRGAPGGPWMEPQRNRT